MPTIRSHFSFEQFEAVLQKLAHEMAVDLLTELKGKNISIRADKGRLIYVLTDAIDFRFFASHLSFSKQTGKTQNGGLAFEIENKEFSTSNHRSKISFWADEKDINAKQKLIEDFLAKLMQGIEPEPRFKLAEHARTA